jgi:hypothetical protein
LLQSLLDFCRVKDAPAQRQVYETAQGACRMYFIALTATLRATSRRLDANPWQLTANSLARPIDWPPAFQKAEAGCLHDKFHGCNKNPLNSMTVSEQKRLYTLLTPSQCMPTLQNVQQNAASLRVKQPRVKRSLFDLPVLRYYLLEVPFPRILRSRFSPKKTFSLLRC